MAINLSLVDNDGGRVKLVGNEIKVGSSLAGSAGARSFTVRMTNTVTGLSTNRVINYRVREALTGSPIGEVR